MHSADDWDRPMGRITPVGTSATLGDGGDSAAMVGFASEISGETFDDSGVVWSRLPLEERGERLAPAGLESVNLTSTRTRSPRDLGDLREVTSSAAQLLASLYVHIGPSPRRATGLRQRRPDRPDLDAKALLVRELITPATATSTAWSRLLPSGTWRRCRDGSGVPLAAHCGP